MKDGKVVLAVDLIAYTAGLIDGEGSIQINPSKSSGNKKYWGLTVQITSCDGEVLSNIRHQWGDIGSITSWIPKGYKRASYNWRLYSNEADILLQSVSPYLRIKKEQAYLGLAFRKYKSAGKGKITEDIKSSRRYIAFAMRELNKKFGKGKTMEKDYREVI